MRSVYDKIEKLYQTKAKVVEDEPEWVEELRTELREIKLLLKKGYSSKKKPRKSKAYFEFVNLLRERLKADTVKEVYPEVYYQGKRVGVNVKGHLYDKETSNSLPAYEAFALYEYFYNKKEQIEDFIVVN